MNQNKEAQMRVRPDFAGETRRGRSRRTNEDQFLIADFRHAMFAVETSLAFDEHEVVFSNSYAQLLIVADGIGGAREGDRASRVATQTASRYLLHFMPWFQALHTDDVASTIEQILYDAIANCQEAISDDVDRHPDHVGMGTSLTLVYLVWPKAYCVHVGNSAAFLLRDRKLFHLTREQTLAHELEKDGVLSHAEAGDSQWRRVLQHPIGGDSDVVEPKICEISLAAGDRLLLVTDGLTRVLDDDKIAAALSRKDPPTGILRQLFRYAEMEDADDDLTAVVARFAAD